MIKGLIQEEDITIVNIYTPNIRAPQNIRKILTDIKGEIDNNTRIVGDFNTPLTPMDRFLEKSNLPSLNQEEIEVMNRPITNIEIKTVIKNLPKQKPMTR